MKESMKELMLRKNHGGKEVLVEVLLIVIALSMVMLFKTQIVGMAENVFEYCNTFIASNFNAETMSPSASTATGCILWF
ncbi:MAG: hypothetical protein K6C69_08055 [Lachnospiraceae bacterium]|nr:hypothetical protein [Lachnospiraceae bacterium]